MGGGMKGIPEGASVVIPQAVLPRRSGGDRFLREHVSARSRLGAPGGSGRHGRHMRC